MKSQSYVQTVAYSVSSQKDEKKENVNRFNVKEWFTFRVIDIAVAATLLAMHIVVMFFSRFTIARLFNFEAGYIMFIIFGLLLGPIKGSLLALIADTLMLLITGSIGTWFWLYALFPPIISIISSGYFYLFQKTKYARLVLSYLFVLIAFIMVLFIYVWKSNPDGSFKVTSKISSPRYIIVFVLVIYALLSFGLTSGFTYLYFKTKNDKWMYYVMTTSLILLISIVVRWILGPVAWIEYYNYIHRSETGTFRTYGVDYIINFVRIVVKDLFLVPIYIALLGPLFAILSFFKEKYISNKAKISY
ncbi:ECF transporter S component [Mycoplasmopsis mucosicanis]|uniref:ECF transporter S component n=1 Tax=Mycoplasmopsis mucosicanis TaxID=458208 RepID=A0A507SMW0_9BACT|nr:ECF transporter S component [Mycoplasmopsis mucosicanis]TQC51364.1 ECF transporter S component [Mycoplasmopsis mucosicanis]